MTPTHRAVTVAIVCLGFVFSLAVQANETPSPAYRKAMQDIKEATDLLRHHGRMVEKEGECCWDWVEKDAQIIQKLYEPILAYWTEKKAADAIQFVKDTISDAKNMEKAAREHRWESMDAAEGSILQVCEPCHDNHRQKMPDGSYEIIIN
jgi:hypothetical protein